MYGRSGIVNLVKWVLHSSLAFRRKPACYAAWPGLEIEANGHHRSFPFHRTLPMAIELDRLCARVAGKSQSGSRKEDFAAPRTVHPRGARAASHRSKCSNLVSFRPKAHVTRAVTCADRRLIFRKRRFPSPYPSLASFCRETHKPLI